jgi:WXG100 family type VII secretion target
MPSEFSKQDAALEGGARLVADAHGELTQQLSTLRGRLAGIGGQWQGGGSTAFQSLMVRWDDDARRILNALSTFENNLRASESTYNTTDALQESSYTRLTGRLG